MVLLHHPGGIAMDGARIKHVIRPIYHLLTDTVGSRQKKSQLRRRLMRLPVTLDYPFDVEAKMLRSIGIRPAMLDVGANTGKYSSVLEDLVGSQNLYIFEPLPRLYPQLRRRFRRAHVFNVALSNADGTATIRVPYIDGQRFDSRATLSAHREPSQTGSDEISVQLFALDSIVHSMALDSIGFIKIDVEGHEDAVLAGAVQTIARFRPLLLVEIEARHHAFPIAEIFAKVESLGYKGYFIDPGALRLREIADFDVQRDQNQEDFVARRFVRYLNNFFFVPDEQEADFVAKARGFLEGERRLVKELTSR